MFYYFCLIWTKKDGSIIYRLNAFKTDLSYCFGIYGADVEVEGELDACGCSRVLSSFSVLTWARSFTDYPENPTASLISLFCVVLLFPLYIHSFQWERRQVFLSLHWSVNIWLHITNWDGIDTSLWAVKPISAMLALRDFFYYLHN